MLGRVYAVYFERFAVRRNNQSRDDRRLDRGQSGGEAQAAAIVAATADAALSELTARFSTALWRRKRDPPYAPLGEPFAQRERAAPAVVERWRLIWKRRPPVAPTSTDDGRRHGRRFARPAVVSLRPSCAAAS